MPKLSEILDPRHVALDVEAESAEGAFKAVTAHLGESAFLSEEAARTLFRGLLDREKTSPTGIGGGIAVPHAYLPEVLSPILLFARLKKPVEYSSPDGKPVDLIFLLAGPEKIEKMHLRVLARIARLLHDKAWCEELRSAKSPEEVMDSVRRVEARHA